MSMLAITPLEQEWYTPSYILDKVYNVFPVSTDPCSNKDKTVNAGTYYMKDDDGLSQSWFGNVYLNPPYGRAIGRWVTKFLEEWDNGNIKSAILLMPVKTDTKWWSKLTAELSCWCAVSGRVKFVSSEPDKKTSVGTFASAIILFTRDDATRIKFYSQFYDIGTLWSQV